MMTLATAMMTSLLSIALASEVLPGCNTDEDCNLNGRCGGGRGGPGTGNDGAAGGERGAPTP